MNGEILDREPPNSPEAEKGVLGSIICDAKVVDQVAEILRPEDFYSDAGRRLFAHILDLDAKGKRGAVEDVALLVESLRDAGELAAIGGLTYLAEVARSVPYAHNAIHYARIVRSKAEARMLIRAAEMALRDAYDQTAEIGHVADSLESALTKIGEQRASDGPADAAGAVLAVNGYVDAMQDRRQTSGVFTGLPEFDRDTGGLHPGEFVILAGSTSSGKSALAGQIADHNCAARQVDLLLLFGNVAGGIDTSPFVCDGRRQFACGPHGHHDAR